MSSLSSYLAQHWLAGLSTVSAFAIGYFADIRKEDHRQKMRRREEHSEEIKKEILRPIYDHLGKFYLPICQMNMSPLEVRPEQISRQDAGSIADDAYLRTEHRIKIRPPVSPAPLGTVAVYDCWPETEGFRRYFDDALRSHYPKLLQKWESFHAEYDSAVKAAKTKAESLIPRLEKSMGLPRALAGYKEMPPPLRANYPRLALLVFHCQNKIGRDSLAQGGEERDPGNGRIFVMKISFSESVVWCAGSQERERIIAIIDGMIKSATPADVSALKAQFKKLETITDRLMADIDFCLAEKPRLKKCPMAR